MSLRTPKMPPKFGNFLWPLLLLLAFAIGGQCAKQTIKSDANFLFLTFSNGSDDSLDVNLVLATDAKKQHTLVSQLPTKGAKQSKMLMAKEFTVREESSADPSSFFSSRSSDKELPLVTANTTELSQSGSVEYKVDGITAGLLKTKPLFPKGNTSYELKVCVFGDFAQNLYEQSELNLSELVDQEQCQLNLFIGKIAWERQLHPRASFAFSPYVMLHSAANANKHLAFARVPSIFGAIGGNLSETSYFQSTEVGDVAFIQITVEIATVASLQDGTVEYEMISQYFRETMLNELECKLQELHRRPKRPWIVLYMTHPYLVSNDEDKVQWFVMNDTNRFFEILKRYKVDLLTSCGIEGMSRMLEAAHKQMPDAKLPEYIQTTMAQCGGYQSVDVTLQNECTYAVLDILPDKMNFRKKFAETKAGGAGGGSTSRKGAVVTNGTIERTFEEADQCVPSDEL